MKSIRMGSWWHHKQQYRPGEESSPNVVGVHGSLAISYGTQHRRRLDPDGVFSMLIVDRLAVWYTIITIAFRCPSHPKTLTSTDSRICKPYLTTKSYIDPFVGPYYHTYAGPYVEKAKPYVDTANTRIIKPATVLATDNYNKYAAPQVAKAKGYTLSRWEKNGLPQFRKAQHAVQQVYDENLAHHVQKASEATTPYYKSARDNALNVHQKHIIPAIAYSQPHLYTAYASAQKFVLEKVMPSIQYAWTNAVIFVDGTLWPFVKKVYGDNVRPQLVMISERIAKYQEGRKLQSAMDEFDRSGSTSITVGTTSDSTTSTTNTATASASNAETTSSTSAAPTPSVATDETVSEDLVKWQQKFAIAADKGTDDLKERIEEIVSSMAKSALSEGHGLATALEKTAEVELASVKAKIKAIALTLPEDAQSTDVSAADAKIVQTVREAGSHVKGKAKDMRVWADKYKQDLDARTQLATDSTLQVLDDIRDLGLQEIGMRWAWMEGITYKHWQKYHDLKRKFADWRSEVRETALSEPRITDAQEQASKLLEESMSVTEDAAKELIRLRDVAKWKIAARDATDDFDTRQVPVVAAAASAASSFAEDIKDAVVGTSQGTVDSLSSMASESVVDGSKSASSVSPSASGTVESLASDASSSASRLSESASSVIRGTTGTIESAASEISSAPSSVASNASLSGASAVSQASAVVEDAASSASSAVVGTSTGSLDSLSSTFTETATSLAYSATTGPSEGILSSGSSIADSISASASSAVASASASQKLQDAVDAAGDKANDLTSSLSAI